MLMRHGLSKCTALAWCFVDAEEMLLSACANGILTCWSASGGHCFRSAAMLPFTAVRLHAYQRNGNCYVVCSGKSTQICIVQMPDMSVVSVFRHRSRVVGTHLTTIINPRAEQNSCCASSKTLFLLSLASGGLLHLWDLETDENMYRSSPSGPSTSKPTVSLRVGEMPSAPTSLAVSSDGERSLIVMKHHWMICLLKTFRMEFLVDADTSNSTNAGGGGWIGGSFLSNNSRIAMWSASGEVHVYLLPLPLSESAAKADKPPRPWLLATLDVGGPSTPPTVQAKVSVLVEKDNILCGTMDGKFKLFEVPLIMLDDDEEKHQDCPDCAHASAKKKVFQRLTPVHTMDIGDAFNDPSSLAHKPENPCTVSVMLTDRFLGLLLVRGHQSGEIIYRGLIHQSLRVDLIGHTGAITSLVAIPSDLSVFGRPLLVSSSEDCSVRIWTVDNAKLLWKYLSPSPVVGLYWHRPKERVTPLQTMSPVPTDTQILSTLVNTLGDLVFVVCTDKSVHVLSLASKQLMVTFRGHDSPVVNIYRDSWCVAADFVVTETARGTVYVWVLSDGRLERAMAHEGGMASRFLKSRGFKKQMSLSSSSPQQPAMPPRTTKKLKKGLRPPLPPEEDLVEDEEKTQVIRVLSHQPLAPHRHLSTFVINVHSLLKKLHSAYNSAQHEPGQLVDSGLLAHLFDFNTEESINQMLKENLGLSPPFPARAFGTVSDDGRAFAVLFPKPSKGLGRWQFAPHVSAIHALCLSTVCMSLLSAGDPSLQIYFSRIVAQYNVLLPETLKGYVEPDLGLLATYALNEDEEIFTVSRLLLQSVVERASNSSRKQFAKHWGAFYDYPLGSQQNFGVEDTGKIDSTVWPGGSIDTRLRHIVTGQAKPSSSTVLSDSEKKTVDGGKTDKGRTPGASVSDQELMSCMVLCLIAAHYNDKAKRMTDAKRRQELKKTMNSQISPDKAADVPAEDDEADDEVPDLDDPMLLVDTAPVPRDSEGGVPLRASQELERQLSSGRVSKKGNNQTGTAHEEKKEKYDDYLNSKAPHVADTLLRVLASYDPEGSDPVNVRTAVDLFGKAFPMLRHHVEDLVAVTRRLHQLSLTTNAALATSAHRALLQAGKGAPRHFVTCMGKEALNSRNSARARSSALMAIVALVRKYPASLAKVLPSAVQIVTRCLDPSEPSLRKSLLSSSTAALHVLVQRYPMVAFHQNSQRFAIGTGQVYAHAPLHTGDSTAKRISTLLCSQNIYADHRQINRLSLFMTCALQPSGESWKDIRPACRRLVSARKAMLWFLTAQRKIHQRSVHGTQVRDTEATFSFCREYAAIVCTPIYL